MPVLMKYSLGPPSDYEPINPPSTASMMNADCDSIVDLALWQSLCVPAADGGCAPQQIPFRPFYDAKLLSSNGERTVTDLISTIPAPPLDITDDLFMQEHLMAIETSATLDDGKKFSAEFFQPNAAVRTGMLTVNEAEARSLSLADSIHLWFAVTGAMRDSVAGSVTLKLQYGTVRPVTVAQCHFSGENMTTWAGPWQGVREISNTGDDLWRPYLTTPPFPGYTSGHAGAAGAGTRMLSQFFPDGSIVGNNCATQLMGTSRTEPRIDAGQPGYMEYVTDVPNEGPNSVGFSPAQDVTLCFSTFTSFADELAESRLLGGIHIPMDNDIGLEWGKQIGDYFYESLIATPTNEPTKAHTPMPVDTMPKMPTDTMAPNALPSTEDTSMAAVKSSYISAFVGTFTLVVYMCVHNRY